MSSGITFEYKKRRSEFGRATKHFSFSEQGTVIDLERNEYRLAEFIPRDGGINKSTEMTTMSTHSINTTHHEKRNNGVLHLEGGWPKDITMLQRIEQIDQKNRFVKRIEKLESFQDELKYCAKKAIEIIHQNNCVDMYELYFSDKTSPQQKPKKRTRKNDGPMLTKNGLESRDGEFGSQFVDNAEFIDDLSTYQGNNEEISLSLKFKHDRSINNITWNSDGSRIGVSYVPQYDEYVSYIWSLSNSITPEHKIQPMTALSFLEFHPKSNSLIIGGNSDGMIEIFDIRRGVKSVNYSVESHKDKINDIKWIQSKNLNQCCSVSNDSNCFFWDIRNLGSPILKFQLMESNINTTNEKKEVIPLNGLTLDYDSEYSIAKMLIGTKEGKILSLNKKSKKKEKVIEKIYDDHFTSSPIYAVQRNPYQKKYFFSISDWSVKIWHDDFPNNPLFETDCSQSYILDGKWNQDSGREYMMYSEAKFELEENNVEDSLERFQQILEEKLGQSEGQSKKEALKHIIAHHQIEQQILFDFLKSQQKRLRILENVIGKDKLIQLSVEKGVCSSKLTGKQFIVQKWYNCKTCGIVDNSGICESCKVNCHKDHETIEHKDSPSEMYCDCFKYDCDICDNKIIEEEKEPEEDESEEET